MKKLFGKYDRVFWDWNGTLLDDAKMCLELINQSLSKRSLPNVSFNEYLEIFEFPVKNYYIKAGFDFNKESFEEVGSEFINAYRSMMFECQLHADVQDTLNMFRSNGIHQYVLSALEEKSLKKILKHYSLDEYFECVKGLTHHYADGKVELGKQLISEIGEKPGKTVMIGDTTHDFETANSIGIDCILIAAGHNSKKRLEKCGVQVFDSISTMIKSI
ncbi:MAG: HAD hydrolase-like protein [Candidatus Riflebacteria bacterium]|nr:HAD hydrolase-like protein [Candidatus Riflebacteria bacterium]